jgi:hypothetical protein
MLRILLEGYKEVRSTNFKLCGLLTGKIEKDKALLDAVERVKGMLKICNL